jgi:hypothetical protein
MNAREQPLHGTPKIHPATREALPEDPLELHGFEVPGDPQLMLRLLVEEYARMGFRREAIMQLARDPNYQVFFALRRWLGEEVLATRVDEILRRCGVMRVTTREAPLPPAQTELFQIEGL